MYCRYCGKENDDKAKFCKYCGKNIEETVQAGSGETSESKDSVAEGNPGAAPGVNQAEKENISEEINDAQQSFQGGTSSEGYGEQQGAQGNPSTSNFDKWLDDNESHAEPRGEEVRNMNQGSTADAQPANSYAAYAAQAQKSGNGQKKKMIIIIAAIAAAVLLIAGVILFLVLNNDDEEYGDDSTVTYSYDEDSDTDEYSDESDSEGVVKITDSGYFVSDGYAYCGVKIKNTSDDKNLAYGEVIATAYDKDGDVLASEEVYINQIQAGDEQAEYIFMDLNGGKASKIEFKADMSDAYEISSDTSIPSSEFEVTGVKEREDDWSLAFTGTIKNNSDKDCEYGTVVLLLEKDDKIVYANSTYIDYIDAGGTEALDFDLYTKDVPDYDSYELIVVDESTY